MVVVVGGGEGVDIDVGDGDDDDDDDDEDDIVVVVLAVCCFVVVGVRRGMCVCCIVGLCVSLVVLPIVVHASSGQMSLMLMSVYMKSCC